MDDEEDVNEFYCMKCSREMLVDNYAQLNVSDLNNHHFVVELCNECFIDFMGEIKCQRK